MPDWPGDDSDDEELAVEWNLDAAYELGDFDDDDEPDDEE